MKLDFDGHKTTGTYEPATATRAETYRCEVGIYLQDGQGWFDSKDKGQTCGLGL